MMPGIRREAFPARKLVPVRNRSCHPRGSTAARTRERYTPGSPRDDPPGGAPARDDVHRQLQRGYRRASRGKLQRHIGRKRGYPVVTIAVSKYKLATRQPPSASPNITLRPRFYFLSGPISDRGGRDLCLIAPGVPATRRDLHRAGSGSSRVLEP